MELSELKESRPRRAHHFRSVVELELPFSKETLLFPESQIKNNTKGMGEAGRYSYQVHFELNGKRSFPFLCLLSTTIMTSAVPKLG